MPSALYLTFFPGCMEAIMVAAFSGLIFNGMGFTMGEDATPAAIGALIGHVAVGLRKSRGKN